MIHVERDGERGCDGKEIQGEDGFGERAAAAGKLTASWADFEEWFGDERRCEEHLLALKYPGGFVCPTRRGQDLGRVGGGRKEWRCEASGRQTSATVGTALEGTKLPLTK